MVYCGKTRTKVPARNAGNADEVGNIPTPMPSLIATAMASATLTVKVDGPRLIVSCPFGQSKVHLLGGNAGVMSCKHVCRTRSDKTCGTPPPRIPPPDEQFAPAAFATR